MARPTTIISEVIGNKLGTVVTVLNPWSVWFQLYDLNENGTLPGFMMREKEYETELDATAMFEAWKKEAKLLVAAGDM